MLFGQHWGSGAKNQGPGALIRGSWALIGAYGFKIRGSGTGVKNGGNGAKTAGSLAIIQAFWVNIGSLGPGLGALQPRS